MAHYLRFAAMISVSTAAMYALSYLNSFSADHVYWSETRIFMALIMGAAMAMIMLGFMRHMYRSPAANVAVILIAAGIFATSLYLVRSQRSVGEIAWMEAMISHHSIAILTSSRAHIEDPRVRKLADEIIAAQRREIGEMKQLIAELQNR